MDAVLRAVAIYVAIMIVFRLAGNRSLAQITTFDLVLLLVISEATQQALLGEDFSFTHAMIVIVTLVGMERVADYLSWRFRPVSRVTQGAPVVLLEDGEPLADRLRKAHVNVEDILAAARERQGLVRLDQIRYAVLEPSGGISVIPVTSVEARHG